MSGYLLDTNVLADGTSPRPNPKLAAWMASNRGTSYTTALNIAELAFGVRRLSAGRKRSALELWLQELVAALEGRILSFNERTAFTWADLEAELERAGRKLPIIDSYIAAIARRHSMTIATRNTRDFERTGVRTVNPFNP